MLSSPSTSFTSFPPDAADSLELWGGVECTVNRVGDTYLDQTARTGHADRVEDLDRFAALGLKTLRYPVLWERTAPHGLEAADWSWPDERLGRLRDLGIRPIAGLVHHGSGPRDTSLVDPAFPQKLAAYARAVASRYPWLDAYTPVNEPLTTARFAGLYGHWYPHGTDERTCLRALLVQCRAVVLAMRAIREINPAARLVQTDDLGKTWSTPVLAYQAEFENERRFVSWDLLCGRVSGPHHRMWHHLRWAGFDEEEILWFAKNPCPPDVIGVNHYLTSERFLDERVDRYPDAVRGSNGRHDYADVEAVRIVTPGVAGVGGVLREAWERYRLPLAVTEAHLGCTREEQMRWLRDVWDACAALKASAGADVRAVTVWSLLGACDWDSLLTRPLGRYEPGVFDLRGGPAREDGLAPLAAPRPTALAAVVRDLVHGRRPDHPVLEEPGWWQRPARLLYEPAEVAALAPAAPASSSAVPVLIVGEGSVLADAFGRICHERGLRARTVHASVLGAGPDAAERLLERYAPWAVVNATGFGPLTEGGGTDAVARLARACAGRRNAVRLVTFSSPLVFDGTARPASGAVGYVEGDSVRPQSSAGRAQVEAETRVGCALPDHALLVRTGPLFGPWEENNFLARGLHALAAGLPVYEAGDQIVTPAYLPDLVHACLDLLLDGESGVWHLAHPDAHPRAAIVRTAARLAGLDPAGVHDWPVSALLRGPTNAPRPAFAALASARGVLLPPLPRALAHFVEVSRRFWADAARAPFAVRNVHGAAAPDPVGQHAARRLPAPSANR